MKLNGSQFTLSTDLAGKTIIVSLFVEVTSAVVFFYPDARVLVLICSSSSLSKEDKVKVEKIVKDFVNNSEKIVTGWLKRTIIDIEPDMLAQLLTPTSDVMRRGPYQGNSPEWGWQRETNRQVQTQQPRGATANYPVTREQAHQETVILECELFYGKIINQFQIGLLKAINNSKVVDFICTNLFEKYKTIARASVKFFKDTSGHLRYTVQIRSAQDPEVEGVKIAHDETLMLSTLVRYGDVSFEKRDVQFHLKDFKIPQEIVDCVKSDHEEYPKVHLFVVCNEKGEYRHKCITGAFSRARGMISTSFRRCRKK